MLANELHKNKEVLVPFTILDRTLGLSGQLLQEKMWICCFACKYKEVKKNINTALWEQNISLIPKSLLAHCSTLFLISISKSDLKMFMKSASVSTFKQHYVL